VDARAPKPTMPGFVLAAYALFAVITLGISAVLFFFLGILFVVRGDAHGDVLRRSPGGRFASGQFWALRLGDSKTVLMGYIYSASDRRSIAFE
jgi:hypothetical protein